MKPEIWYHPLLECPRCASDVNIGHDAVQCQKCEFETRDDPPDFIPNALRFANIPSTILENEIADILASVDLTRPDTSAIRQFPGRDARELVGSIAGRFETPRVLDLGCGTKEHATIFESIGSSYVGMDPVSDRADIRGDAHRIPMKASSVDIVFSYAVLEHLHNPGIAMMEIERVLAPGGVLVGTVSQGEPFHDSYFHMTAWGLISLARVTSLRLERLWPSRDTLFALAEMGRYPKVLKPFLGFLGSVDQRLPFLAPRRMRSPKRARMLEDIYRAGSLCFLFVKPERGETA